MAVTRRGDCFSSQWQKGKHIVPASQVLLEREKAIGEKGKVAGLQQLDRKSPAGQVSPISSHLQTLSLRSLSTPLPTHFDTTYQLSSNTGDYIPLSSLPDETEQ